MIKRKCLLLFGDKKEIFFIHALKKLSKEKKFTLVMSDNHQAINKTIDFVLCIRYPRLIPKEYIDSVQNGIYVFHSSDLPKGKGWAPVYHSIVNSKEKKHVLTTLKINEKIDAGEIIAKTYFKKRNGENADSLMEVDNIMTMKTIQQIIGDLLFFSLKGKKQIGKGSYYKRRFPQDSEVQSEDTLQKIHYHCLAVGGSHPAFYYFQGKKYIIHIRPESLDECIQSDIKITTFYEKKDLA